MRANSSDSREFPTPHTGCTTQNNRTSKQPKRGSDTRKTRCRSQAGTDTTRETSLHSVAVNERQRDKGIAVRPRPIPRFHHHHHQSLNREGRWGTTDDFATSFLHFSLFSTALWDLPDSRPVHSLMLSSHLFLCPPCLLPPFTVPCKMVLARPDERQT